MLRVAGRTLQGMDCWVLPPLNTSQHTPVAVVLVLLLDLLQRTDSRGKPELGCSAAATEGSVAVHPLARLAKPPTASATSHMPAHRPAPRGRPSTHQGGLVAVAAAGSARLLRGAWTAAAALTQALA